MVVRPFGTCPARPGFGSYHDRPTQCIWALAIIFYSSLKNRVELGYIYLRDAMPLKAALYHMKKLVCTFLLFTWSYIQAQKPVSIIFDTDIAPDYDDVGALALLHALADQGEARILATISSNAFETTGPTLSVFNTYFRRPDLPVGVTYLDFPNKACIQGWAQAILTAYPHSLGSNRQAQEAVSLYRKILASQPAQSVTIVTVGFFTNLAGLLDSGPDTFSSLTGKELIAQKVHHLVSMATRIDSSGTGGYEFNVLVDPSASQKVFDGWPTPVTISGFEIGEQIHTGIRLIHNDAIQNSPVKDAFRIALEKDGNTQGRCSWDETAVLVAVRGAEPYFSLRKLNFKILPDGKDLVIPGERFMYLQFKQSPDQLATLIEDLMMHQPK
jgi:inosine-uridine nucleoside N-ribohydrolase